MTIDSVSVVESVTVTLPTEYWRPPPAPEPSTIPLMLLAIAIAALLLRKHGRESK